MGIEVAYNDDDSIGEKWENWWGEARGAAHCVLKVSLGNLCLWMGGMSTMVMSPTLLEMCSSCSSRWCWWTRGWGRPRFHCLCHVFCFHIPWCLWLDLAFVEKYRKYSASTSNNWWLVYVVFFLFFCCITCKRWLLRHAPLVLGRGLEPRSKPYLGPVDPDPKPCSWEGWYILSPTPP